MFTQVLNVLKCTKHTAIVGGQAIYTIRTVLYTLTEISGRVVELNLTVHIVLTSEVEVVLVVVRVILVGCHICIGIGETDIAPFTSIGHSNIVVLVVTGAENFLPRIAAHRAVLASAAVPVINILAVILGTPVVG